MRVELDDGVVLIHATHCAVAVLRVGDTVAGAA
jgi:hypothetical protein